ncbi:IMPACT family member in pol 5'region isoform X1 [Tripterygium wilfordii]|uniref:IMPACT family member in pol 5'region isoform X1 n=1 Tax=Tripterygium wilfordii TaxID=458696 RepID=UPI0018F85542|nr:IMPACT family member in pol 5'region isoform X1 [Tripterygium wilfordii]
MCSTVTATIPASHHYHILNLHLRIFAITTVKRAMVTTATGSSSSTAGAYTTIKERVSFEREIKKSKFIAIAGPISDERSAHSFLSEVRDPRATHNCWAYKILNAIPTYINNSLAQDSTVGRVGNKDNVGEQYRCNDDGEPSGTAGKPIQTAIDSSGIDRVMVVVIRYFGGIKLGTGGLVRAYGGVAAECLRNSPTCLVKSKVPMGVEVSFNLLGSLYHQLQSFQAEDIRQDYETGKDGITMVSFKVDFDQAEKLEDAIKANCSRELVFYRH